MKLKSVKGKNKEEIISILGQDYLPQFREDVLVYIINRTWINPKGNILYIEFNKDGAADTIYTQKNNDFK